MGLKYRASTSVEIGRLEQVVPEARRIEVELRSPGLSNRFQQAHIASRQLLIILDRQEHMSGAATVSNKHWALASRLLGPTGTLVEFTAGERRCCQFGLLLV